MAVQARFLPQGLQGLPCSLVHRLNEYQTTHKVIFHNRDRACIYGVHKNVRQLPFKQDGEVVYAQAQLSQVVKLA